MKPSLNKSKPKFNKPKTDTGPRPKLNFKAKNKILKYKRKLKNKIKKEQVNNDDVKVNKNEGEIKTGWQQIPVEFGGDIEFDGFGGIEELTDYGILKRERQPQNQENDSHLSKVLIKSKKQQKKPKRKLESDEDLGYNSDQNTEKKKDFHLANSPRLIPKSKKNKVKPVLKKENKLRAKIKDESIEEENGVSKDQVDMSKWDGLFVPPVVLKALEDEGFLAPTPIQALTLVSAIEGRMDILGAAETGSGKTLAFGIPLIHGILRDKENEKLKRESLNGEVDETDDENVEDEDRPENRDEISNLIKIREKREPKRKRKCPEKPLRALVLTPTRELAIQVQRHIQVAAKYTDIRVAVVVGGMAPQKQIRILGKRPEIVVATPGRLWELIEQEEEHLTYFEFVKYLVIDEADRMAEKGHFAELKKILDLLKSEKSKRQNFVFSATLTLIHDTPKRVVLKKKKYKVDQKRKLESIMSMVGMKDKPKIVDLSKKFGTADSLTEAKIFCEAEEKDWYLYYFWLTYPGRTLVFCNSIDCVRRLNNVFDFLNCKPLPLHASMQQRQRLKNLDKFKDNPHALLLATDVAARGLDIPSVQHVIHYQLPRTAEGYVHRSGRTARALNEGLSLMLLSSPEVGLYRKMCRTLNRDKDLPDFPVEQAVFSVVQERVKCAMELDVLVHREKKKSSMSRWITQAAESMEIDINDKELLKEVYIDDEAQSKITHRIKSVRQELNRLLQKTITPRGMLTNYPTKSGKLNLPSDKTPDNAISVVGSKMPWQQVSSSISTANKKLKQKKKKMWKKKK